MFNFNHFNFSMTDLISEIDVTAFKKLILSSLVLEDRTRRVKAHCQVNL